MNLSHLTNRFKKLDLSKIMGKVFKADNADEKLLRKAQIRLYFNGETSDGKKMRTDLAEQGEYYAPSTIQIKKKRGQPTDRVTLKNKGDFEKSIKLDTSREWFTYSANFYKKRKNSPDRKYKRRRLVHISLYFTEMFDSEQDFEERTITNSPWEVIEYLRESDHVIIAEIQKYFT